MKKFSIVFLILFLIMFTAFIKNSTKRVDDQIFITKENIRGLKKDFENIKTINATEKKIKIKQLKIINEQ